MKDFDYRLTVFFTDNLSYTLTLASNQLIHALHSLNDPNGNLVVDSNGYTYFLQSRKVLVYYTDALVQATEDEHGNTKYTVISPYGGSVECPQPTDS